MSTEYVCEYCHGEGCVLRLRKALACSACGGSGRVCQDAAMYHLAEGSLAALRHLLEDLRPRYLTQAEERGDERLVSYWRRCVEYIRRTRAEVAWREEQEAA